MNVKKSLIVYRKDWREVRRNWQVMLPIIILPVIFAVVLPLAMSSGVSATKNTTSMPIGAPETQGMDTAHALLYSMLIYLIAPFFLIIPLMASSVIASDSFAGEKERKTTEALLATPLTDGELFLGKVLAAFVPAMFVTILSFIVYAGMANAVFGSVILPNMSWIFLVFLLAPALALAAIGVTVLVSSRVKGFREAQQISGIMIIPVLLLMFGQLSGMLLLGPFTVLGIALALFVLDAIILRAGVRLFSRENLLSKFG